MDFYGHKIGETPFYLEEALMDRLADIKKANSGVPRIYVKDEADNPSGGHKARVVAPAIAKWAEADADIILARLTEGGFTGTFGYLSKLAPGNVSFASVVDYSMPKAEVERLRQYGPVVRADLDAGRLSSSQIANLVRKGAERRNAVVIPIDNIDADGEGFEAIAVELYEHGVDGDYTIYLPVGGGNTMVGIVRGFEKLGKVPKTVGATIPGNLYSDVLENGHGARTHLHAGYSGVRREMYRIMAEHDVEIVTIFDEEQEEALGALEDVGLRSSDTSSVPWAAIERHAREGKFKDGESVVFLNTGYEAPPLQNKLVGRYLSRVAAAILAGSLVSVPSGINQSTRELKWREEGRKLYLSQQGQELARNPLMSEIIAYSLWRGGMTEIDRQVLNDLEYWHLSNDMIARMMYNDAKHTRFKGNVDNFDRWRIDQKNAKDEENRKYLESLRQMIERK